MAETTHTVTAPVILDAHATQAPTGADYTAAAAAGVRAWADLLGRAALRLRTPLGETTALGERIAVLLDQEAEIADQCPGFICPPRPAHKTCEVDDHSGAIDEPEELESGKPRTHHHCAWCNAWTRTWEEDEPAMVRLATAVLEAA